MLNELLHAVAARYREKTAVVAHDRRLTYAQLATEAVRLADELRRGGAEPGDRVAVLLTNSAEAAVSIWAALEAACVVVPMHAASRPAILLPVLRDAEPRWLVSSAGLSRTVNSLLDSRTSVEVVLEWPGTGAPAADDSRRRSWDFDAGTAASPAPARAARESSDIAALLYTSGTTGEPKGVMLSHDNMTAALRAVNAYLKVVPEDVLYSALPLASSYGLYQLLLALTVGATVVLDRSFAFPAQSLALAAAEGATVFAGVPTMYAWLATTPILERFELRGLRLLTSAAAALPVNHAQRVRERFPHARLFVMYGQTECKRISYLDPEDLGRKPGSVGRGMPYQEHVVLGESGEPAAPGEVGELVVRGPHVMLGYWRNPEATALKLRPIPGHEGDWLHTDDLFRTDAEGYLYFVGRRDEILKVGGHKVSPAEVEDVLCQMPEVNEAAVTSIEDATWGQAVKAHVVLNEGATCDEQTIIQFCRLRLPGYMVPKAVAFAARLPKTESGKTKRRDLL